jgi:hypothetical protein
LSEQQYDLFQRWGDPRLGTRAALEGLQSRIYTSLPCKVVAPGYDANTQTVTVQSTIKGRLQQRGDNGKITWKDVSMPIMTHVPVEFPTGGGMSLTFPIKLGMEGVVHFQSRAIDNWWANGGEQPQLTPNGVGSLRQHSLSDGVFRPGARSKPNALKNVSQTSTQLRTDDGTTYIDFSATGVKFVFPNGKQVIIDAATGGITATGEVTRGFGTGDQVTVGQHKHAAGPIPDPGT